MELLDPGSPPDGDSIEVQFIVDEGAGPHDDGAGREDAKAQKGRRDALEVVGVGEEGKDLGPGPGKEDGALETVGHSGIAEGAGLQRCNFASYRKGE